MDLRFEDFCRKNRAKMSRILFLVNHDVVIYNFRLEIVERYLSEGHEVHVSSPFGERISDLVSLGVVFHEIKIDRHGMNPVKEIQLLREYKKLIRKVSPDIILGFTIKPNIYGAIAARKCKIPFVANITGLGTAVENKGLVQKITILLYKYAFRNIRRVFFQNKENQQFFVNHKIAVNKHSLLPGSGVNLQRFSFCPYPESEITKFAFISRIMKEKGIDQFLAAAEYIKNKYANVEFHICGFCEEDYCGRLQELHDSKTVIYHGMVRDISSFMKEMNVIVHPSYYPEGISNVLLEACATGRPIITTDRAGCREVVDDEVNGYVVREKDSADLIKKIEQFLSLTYEQKTQMGLRGREKVERDFDRNFVVDKYVAVVSELTKFEE